MIRVLSSRVPYQRGGLSFTSSTARAADGRRVINLDREERAKLSDADWHSLVSDPAIEIQYPMPEGAGAGGEEAVAAPVVPETQATGFSRPSKPLSAPLRRRSRRSPIPKPTPEA